MISKINIYCNDNECTFSGKINKNDIMGIIQRFGPKQSLSDSIQFYPQIMQSESDDKQYTGQAACTDIQLGQGSNSDRIATLRPGTRTTWSSPDINIIQPGSYKIIVDIRVNSEITWTPFGSIVNIEFDIQRRPYNIKIGEYKLVSPRNGADWHVNSFTITSDPFDINEKAPFSGFNIYMIDDSSRYTFFYSARDNEVWNAVYVKSYRIQMCE